ncbi:MAG TPA: hypothetical protein VGM19_12660 [Armatimonadota bacterium]|jgi:hypothetical protein
MTRTTSLLLLSVLLALAGLATGASAEQPTAIKYVVTLSTETMAMPFAMPNIPGMANIPGLADMFKPKRVITGLAEYAVPAVEPIFVGVPGDLKLPQNKLVLTVDKPTPPGPDTPAEPGTTEPAKPTKMTMTMKLYWHPDVAEGPVTNTLDVDSSRMPTAPQGRGPATMDWSRLAEEFDKTAAGSNDKLPEKVVGAGDYVLNTGGFTATLAGFLPPLKITAPETLADVDPAAGFELTWEPVAGARGFIIQITGMENHPAQGTTPQSMTIYQWVSSTVEPPERVRHDYEQATTIADDLDKGILLPAETLSCVVPPNVFPTDVPMLTVNVVAVGADFYNQAGTTTVVGKIRSRWTGMKMSMAGMPGMPPAEE